MKFYCSFANIKTIKIVICPTLLQYEKHGSHNYKTSFFDQTLNLNIKLQKRQYHIFMYLCRLK